MAYGRRKFRRSGYGRKRFGRSYRKKGFRTRYRKMGKSRSKLYRTAGGYAGSGGAKPELKSYDSLPLNWLCAPASALDTACATVPWYNNRVQNTALGAAQPYKAAAFTFDSVTSNNNPDTAGHGAWLCNGIGQGNDIMNRIGRRVRIRSIKIDMVIKAAGCTWTPTANNVAWTVAANTATPNGRGSRVRLLLVLDRQCNGTMPGKTDVLAPEGTPGVNFGVTGTVTAQSSVNLQNRDRFLIIFDKEYLIDDQISWVKSVRIYKKLNIETTYGVGNGAGSGILAADVSAVLTNGIFLFGIADATSPGNGGAAATQAFGCPVADSVACRVRFTDA